jgi:hypothetical protein
VRANPLAEARARLGNGYEVRVLEPAPPAVTVEPFSDDPTARGEVPAGRTLVAPFETGVAGDRTWDELARDDDDLADWCAARALGSWRPPPPLPALAVLHRTRLSLHAVAEHVVCPARHRVNGKIGLRFTRGGFGTPFFGRDEQVRVEGSTLVHAVAPDGTEARSELTTLRAAAAAIGIEAGAPRNLFEPATPLDLDRVLELDGAGVAVFAWWYGIAASVLAQLRADAESRLPGAAPPSLVQLWPEHFDIATDLAAVHGGPRANYGASPGDAAHPEPYLYVGPWDLTVLETTGAPDGYWNESFGASMPYSALAAADDARGAALTFFRDGRARLGLTP